MDGQKSAVAALLAAALAGAAVACSGAAAPPADHAPRDHAPGDHRGEVRDAADALRSAGTSRVRSEMRMESGGTRVTIRGEGVYDHREGVGRFSVILPGSGRPTVTEVFAPGALYMKNRGAGVPADKWVRVDTAALPDGNLVTNGVTDPATAAELLSGAVSVTFLGSTVLSGERVRRYRGTTDLVAAADRSGGRTRAQLSAAAEGFSETRVPFDAYIDGQGRLRKVRHAFVFDNSAGEGVRVDSTTALHGFGVASDVSLPEAGDIYSGTVAEPGQ